MTINPLPTVWIEPPTHTSVGTASTTATIRTPTAEDVRLFGLYNQMHRLGIDMEDLIKVLEEM